MEEHYDFKTAEVRIMDLWEKIPAARPRQGERLRPFSMHLIPPNASGPLHIGNALMIAIQDVLARYHRARGAPTLWIPGTDHGGYETQITFEQEMEKTGNTPEVTRRGLYAQIAEFVERNIEIINRQIKRAGASVDWSRLRHTLDSHSLAFVEQMFRKMVSENLIYRSSYMMNYCTSCATILADIELKEMSVSAPLYWIKFPFTEGEGCLSFATTRPEFLYSVTHVLAHRGDQRLAPYIGSTLVNPSTGEPVEVIESKRKFDSKDPEPTLFAFTPSHKKYDFEYAIRHAIPTRTLLDWEGRMIERYPGLTPTEAREQEIAYLTQREAIERVDETHTDVSYLCKKGHGVETVIRMSWFLRLDDPQHPLRQKALEAMQRERLVIIPRWREKSLREWIGKMHDWPLGRQNVWGIAIPVWYEITDPSLFTIWFFDAQRVRRHGNLKDLLAEGYALEEIENNLERIYGAEGAVWTLTRVPGKTYLPETDTFDTWFSSGAWSAMVFDPQVTPELRAFYPSSVIVIGYDLLRLSIARKILLGVYLTGRLPFHLVYFHSLLKSSDGQKMSKSLGNATTLDYYLETYGADVTRLALISYMNPPEDFYFSEERLRFFVEFARRLWVMGRISYTATTYAAREYRAEQLSAEDIRLLTDVAALGRSVAERIEKYYLTQAQEKLVDFLTRLEEYAAHMPDRRGEVEHAMAVFHHVFKDYIASLHPFMPFMTEELNREGLYSISNL